ncbi:hypothetical protein GDO86_017705 [Hymenochirus boettgeri]|uniref:G-protein coupled receptors family 1 profile domain-containing protein n=1 Tax=Hymenochirus boettgeri TaxID=247094 RepID=A0A8T2IKN4_9PIPI|nr:hypothetical protein GDO86_017705 [Hymenochirus boettgeri]
MDQSNVTFDGKFILLGFSHVPHLRFFLIYILLVLYICTLLGNSLIIQLIINDPHLHTPMYFFLANLSVLDILSPSVTVPKMIWDLFNGEGVISLHCCITQQFFFLLFLGPEPCLLSVMAFDRYVAICNPLHYTNIMSYKLCSRLLGGTWLLGIFYSVFFTGLTFTIDFCGPNHIDHIYCDFLPLFQLACSDISLNLSFIYLAAFLNGVCNFTIILSSYGRIVLAIIRIKTKEGRIKAFSTCSSHVIVFSVFYFSIFNNYLHPISSSSGSKDMIGPVIYTSVTPVLNPIIYSFRNNDVKRGLKKQFFILISTGNTVNYIG